MPPLLYLLTVSYLTIKRGCEEMIYIFSQSFSYFCMFFSSRRFIRESPASLTISF